MTDATLPVTAKKPVVLCILDGWGWREGGEDNAIAKARTPNWRRLLELCPRSLIRTSGLAVGLPDGQMGNSEVGHMNLGGGRVVMQDLPRIDQAVADGSLAENAVLLKVIEATRASGGVLHILGLLSPGGVHSHQDHMAGLVKIAASHGVKVVVHGFLDGRDTPPKSALDFLAAFEAGLDGIAGWSFGTLTGRYFAMDRDKRWERVNAAFSALVDGQGAGAPSAREAIEASYAAGITDEFVKPAAIGHYRGMQDGDGLVMANFRADRAREILVALLDATFDGFERPHLPKFAGVAGMVEYSSQLNGLIPAIFPAERVEDPLGAVVAKAGKRQLRIAETEKYAHVTFFFNGGEETVFEGEDRILVPSPKVATYDLDPAMSAHEVTDKLVAAIEGKTYDLIVVNYANPDMVGHTGIMAAAIQAVETIDTCLGRLSAAVEAAGGVMLVTADHGNIEQMYDPETDGAYTAHTTNLVPALLFNAGAGLALADGRLADIAPTLLPFLGIAQPAAMTGHSLLAQAPAAAVSDRRASA
ncbi:2,3-bisphosphoglycerate-independent phosphoglycerate mutase [Zavarzinia compransoris]|uniref:2,3-bisphosphoglycerate-independent phosphoglycerate mutase n=1 Tax=Zavarzinia compransoris TaxID=1264899 RepID=A0A317E674_9PROT|nr:2,3-bisphosphoglycerate-independent phosphoglycerate mutase [Zavarzinia compransoris]PWR21706.1 2,3-bisphosphoglycerate-independent phosphoglycerate mutase [Zavarzinia compransoris]TDP45508.1 phosphoglycerate mutase [Zavarzinia compransoris]